MSLKQVIWYYIDNNNRQQGPFSAFHMAQWMDCGYFKDDLKCRTSEDKDFHTIKDWKWIAGTKNPFLSVLESFDSARWKTFPSLSLDYLKFADTEIPLHAQPAVIDLYKEREHCKRLFDSLPKTTAAEHSTEAARTIQVFQKKTGSLKSISIGRRRYLDRTRRGSFVRNPTMRYVKYRPRFYKHEEKTKITEQNSNEQLDLKERPALRLIWHKLCVSTAENPWGKRNNRKKFKAPEEWKHYPTTVPWTVIKSDNRFSVITSVNQSKMRPIPFPTILAEQHQNKLRYNQRSLEKQKNKESNTPNTINVSNWPEILTKLSGIKISGSE